MTKYVCILSYPIIKIQRIKLSDALYFHMTFQDAEAHGYEEGHNEIINSYDDQRREWLEADALDGGGGIHQVCHTDDRNLGGFLDQSNKFIPDDRQNVSNSLGDNDADHGFPFGKAQ